ncbi:MAG: hypothetical protein IKT43_02885, partial [Clostridia bacterium]|nr:hypothetical protein [Clostridia bacterium]
MKQGIRIGLCYFGEGEGNGAANGQPAEESANTAAENARENPSPAEAEERVAGVARGKERVVEGADPYGEPRRAQTDETGCEVINSGEPSAPTGETGESGAAEIDPAATNERVAGDVDPYQGRTAAASHYGELCRQSAALKAVYPSFNLRDELRNPTFLRLTAPGGVSVEDAFYTVHRKELGAAALQVIAQRTAEKLSSAVISGSRRPIENGAKSTAATINTFDYRAATPSQREAFKRDL